MYESVRVWQQNARFGPDVHQRDERVRELVRSAAEADAASSGGAGRLWTDWTAAVHAERGFAAGAGTVERRRRE